MSGNRPNAVPRLANPAVTVTQLVYSSNTTYAGQVWCLLYFKVCPSSASGTKVIPPLASRGVAARRGAREDE